MEYTIIVNGQSYDLPKKTIVVMSELDEVLKVDSNTKLSIKQKYEKIHAFIKNLVGYESAKEIFGSDDLNEIDFVPIVDDYDLHGTYIETIACKLYEYLRQCDTE